MSRKRYTPEQIIGKLREAEVLLSQGQKTGEVCRRLGISEQKLRDELLNGEIFYTPKEAQVLIEQWRRHYNTLHAAQRAGLQTTGTGLARHQCAGLRCAPATTWGLATTPDSLIKGGPLRSGWSRAVPPRDARALQDMRTPHERRLGGAALPTGRKPP